MEYQDKTKEQLADELRQSERRFRSFTEGAPDYIVEVDRDGKIRFVNRTYEGVTKDAVIGTSIFEWLPERFRPGLRAALARALASGESEVTEYQAPDPAGRDLWYSAHIGAVRGEGPTDTAILVIRDITKGKRAEDMLHTQRDLAIALAAGPSLDEGLRLCLEAALRVSGMNCGGVYLFDDTTGELRLAFHTGLLESFVRCASSCKERRVIVSVQDEGCGISEADLTQIQNPFYTTKRDEGRMGLGLAVAARIVSEHEGCLGFESRVGEGTTARVLLPVLVEDRP